MVVLNTYHADVLELLSTDQWHKVRQTSSSPIFPMKYDLPNQQGLQHQNLTIPIPTAHHKPNIFLPTIACPGQVGPPVITAANPFLVKRAVVVASGLPSVVEAEVAVVLPVRSYEGDEVRI